MSVRSRSTCTSTVLPSTIDGVNSGATNVVKTRLALVVDSQMFWNVCCRFGLIRHTPGDCCTSIVRPSLPMRWMIEL